MLGHLDAAYNLARWLLRNDDNAREAVQEAYLRAFRFFDDWRGQDAKPWLLTIVRNECFALMRQLSKTRDFLEFDEERDSVEAIHATAADPEAQLLSKLEKDKVNAALAQLPSSFCEVLVLREMEELSYQEIARITGIPIGTVMSRLARARIQLRSLLRTEN